MENYKNERMCSQSILDTTSLVVKCWISSKAEKETQEACKNKFRVENSMTIIALLTRTLDEMCDLSR